MFESEEVDNGTITVKAFVLLRNQPEMCKWNCGKLAEAIKWALPERLAREELPIFDVEYER